MLQTRHSVRDRMSAFGSSRIDSSRARPSVQFNAVALVLSDDCCATLMGEAAAIDFVKDTFGHLKAIGHTPEAQPLLDKAGVTPDERVAAIGTAAGPGSACQDPGLMGRSGEPATALIAANERARPGTPERVKVSGLNMSTRKGSAGQSEGHKPQIATLIRRTTTHGVKFDALNSDCGLEQVQHALPHGSGASRQGRISAWAISSTSRFRVGFSCS